MEVEVNKLRPHPLNENIYPTDEAEDEELEKSIKDNGILEKLVATPDGTIISGARRWRLAKKLGITHVDCELRSFDDPEQAIIEYNRYRRKTPRILANEYNFIKQRSGGDEKKIAQLKHQEDRFPNFEKTTEEPIRADKKAAEVLGVSSGKLYEIDYIFKHEDVAKPVVEKLDREEISVHQAFLEVKRTIEPPKADAEPKAWKCGVCLQEQDVDVTPVAITVCPDCAMDFQTWKADKKP
jgi:ParB-like chromosome segregation protein Spo0J